MYAAEAHNMRIKKAKGLVCPKTIELGCYDKKATHLSVRSEGSYHGASAVRPVIELSHLGCVGCWSHHTSA